MGSVLGFRRIFSPVLSSKLSCETAHGQSLMYEVSKRMQAGGVAALQYMATRLQARAVDAAPHRVAPKKTGKSQLHDCQKKTAELLTPYPTKFGIPVALEATTTSKEVLVRHPAPPGFSPFFKPNFNTGEGVIDSLPITLPADKVTEGDIPLGLMQTSLRSRLSRMPHRRHIKEEGKEIII
jgi:hypothetical protein